MTFDAILEKKEVKNFHVPEILTDKKDFDGPLDLLLYLIQENQANVYDLPISLITDQFLEYIERNEADITDLADFYKTGADLLYIKTRLLLPHETELDEVYEDPRQELVDRLIEYQKYKKLTALLTGQDMSDHLYINRPENYFSIPFDDKELFENVSINDLAFTFSSILGKKPPTKIFNVYREVTISEKEALIMELLDREETVTIEEAIQDFTNPLHTICTFLAILVLAKKNVLLFLQKVPDGTIYLFRRPDDWSNIDPEINDRMAEEEIEKGPDGSRSEMDFTLLNKEASMDLDELIKEKIERMEDNEKINETFISEEEEIDLDDDD